MAEECIPTALLFGKVSNRLKEDAGAKFTYMDLCTVDMATFDKDEINFTGLAARESVAPEIATEIETDDVIQMEKAAWKPGADEIWGAGVFCDLAGDTLMIYHEWAASVVFEADDTVTETIRLQSQLGT